MNHKARRQFVRAGDDSVSGSEFAFCGAEGVGARSSETWSRYPVNGKIDESASDELRWRRADDGVGSLFCKVRKSEFEARWCWRSRRRPAGGGWRKGASRGGNHS